MMFAGFLIFMAFLSLVIQEFIPPLEAAHGARVFLLPVVLFYGSLALPYGGALLLAFVSGFFWDLYTLQFVDGRVEISLGWSIIVFSVLCSTMHGLRPLFLRGRWEVHCLVCGLCTSSILLAEFLMITFRRGLPEFPTEIWWRIGVPGLIALLLAPPCFFIFNRIAGLLNHPIRQESRSL